MQCHRQIVDFDYANLRMWNFNSRIKTELNWLSCPCPAAFAHSHSCPFRINEMQAALCLFKFTRCIIVQFFVHGFMYCYVKLVARSNLTKLRRICIKLPMKYYGRKEEKTYFPTHILKMCDSSEYQEGMIQLATFSNVLRTV